MAQRSQLDNAHAGGRIPPSRGSAMPAADAPKGVSTAETDRAPGGPALTVAWLLLLALGALFVFASLSDLSADTRVGLPVDHTAAFASIAGVPYQELARTSPRVVAYITTLEVAYAVHELVFGLLFLLIVAIPFRRRLRWAWWACWVPMLANITYSVTFGRHDTTALYRSLVADILLPILLLVHIPAFFGKRARTA